MSYRSPRRYLHTNPTISKYVNAPSPALKLHYPDGDKVTTTPRECLMCSRQFPSEHKAHRICDHCKRTEEWLLEGDI